jgi:D-3-phosphoglycerate dehydrogenase / 2-oxoglutarate reductase
MKVLICDKTEKDAIERMRKAGIEVDVRDDISAEELPKVLPAYDGMVVRSRTKVRTPLIDVAKNLKVIMRGGVGLDNIDADYARAKGITILNTPAASSASVAELTIAYMFALARPVVQATLSMRAGEWEKKKFEGREISGKTLGIVGSGRIGSEVASRAAALGMQVLVYDPYLKQVAVGKLVSLDEVLASADYITFHLPHTDETHNMIGAAQFAKMKTGVRIVNCARGGIVDEQALYDAIVSGKVAAAALDVFAQEPLVGSKLFTLEQVIGSPHIGASTEEALSRVGAEVADKLIEFYQKNRG